jgi:hypothetical protein
MVKLAFKKDKCIKSQQLNNKIEENQDERHRWVVEKNKNF